MGPLAMGQHSTDNTPQPPLGMMVGGDPHTFYKAFNISYAETGIFGKLYVYAYVLNTFLANTYLTMALKRGPDCRVGLMRKLKVAHRAIERVTLGISLRDRIRNEDTRRRTNLTDWLNGLAC